MNGKIKKKFFDYKILHFLKNERYFGENHPELKAITVKKKPLREI